MISELTGELFRVEEDRVHLRAGPIAYELLVPAADLVELHGGIGQTHTFHTLFYLEGDATRGNLQPRLIGFLRPEDRRFFDRFTTVKGIGPRTALRALTVPVGQIARAIESKDARFLVGLQGIGKRTAELIIAELAGKVGHFITAAAATATISPTAGGLTPAEEDALAALMALGERRADAERLLGRARQSNPDLASTESLVREMLRLRGARG